MDEKQRKQIGFSVGYFLLALLGVWLIQVFFIRNYSAFARVGEVR
jgi:hypothetical protein